MRVHGDPGLARWAPPGVRHHYHSSRPERSARDSRVQASRQDYLSLKAGALEVTTDDGDKVSISFATLDQLSKSAAGAVSGDSAVGSSSSYSARGMSVAVTIDGSLDSEETADISELMQSLFEAAVGGQTGATPDAASLESLDRFQFAYMEGVRLSSSQFAAQYA